MGQPFVWVLAGYYDEPELSMIVLTIQNLHKAFGGNVV